MGVGSLYRTHAGASVQAAPSRRKLGEWALDPGGATNVCSLGTNADENECHSVVQALAEAEGNADIGPLQVTEDFLHGF